MMTIIQHMGAIVSLMERIEIKQENIANLKKHAEKLKGTENGIGLNIDILSYEMVVDDLKLEIEQHKTEIEKIKKQQEKDRLMEMLRK